MRFSATTPTMGSITWEDGEFSGNLLFLQLIKTLVESGEMVPTIEMGPAPVAATEPQWVAWYTAHRALDDVFGDVLVWEGESAMPRELYLYPPNAVA